MDPVSHLLFGRTLALTAPRRSRPNGLTAGLVLGSLAPDIDGVLAFRGFDGYLRAHASGTHSLTGTVVGATLLALVLRRLIRDSRLAPLAVASWVGMAGHILGDVADDGDIAVFWPFSHAVIGWHLFAMGDPLILAVLVFTFLLAWRCPRAAQAASVYALIALIGLTGLKIYSQRRALAHYQQAAGATPETAAVTRPGRVPVDWMFYDRAGDRVRGWRVNAWNGRTVLTFERRDPSDVRLVDASRELPVVRTFLGFASLPFARVEAEGRRDLILWSDARWCSADRCDLSFGGAFESGVMIYQMIRIGPFTQQRSTLR